MPLSPEDILRKARLIKLADDLAPVPKFGATAIQMRLKGIAMLKAEILTDESKALLGDDYDATKAKVEGLA